MFLSSVDTYVHTLPRVCKAHVETAGWPSVFVRTVLSLLYASVGSFQKFSVVDLQQVEGMVSPVGGFRVSEIHDQARARQEG